MNLSTGITVVSALAVKGEYLFAGTPGGGVFRSTNRGGDWAPVNNGLGNASVSAFAVKDAYLFVGIPGGGVYRSATNGDDWGPVNTGLTELSVVAFAVRNGVLFAGTSGGGVFKSTDDGETWVSANDGLTNASVTALAVSASYLFAGTQDGVFRSADGVHWTRCNLAANTRVSVLATNGEHLFAVDVDGVIRSTDYGATWTPVNTGLIDPLGNRAGIGCFAVDGTHLFAGSFNAVFRSSNDGDSWTPGNAGFGYAFATSLAVGGTKLFAGTNDGSIFRSASRGASWDHVKSGLTNTSVTALALNGGYLFAGTAGAGAFRSANDGYNWVPVNTGLADASINAFVVWNGALFAGTNGGIFSSANNGDVWVAVNDGLTNTSITALTANESFLFAGTQNGAFRSADGVHWTACSLPAGTWVSSLATSGSHVFAGESGPGSPFQGEAFFVSPDNGNSWGQVNTNVKFGFLGFEYPWNPRLLAVSGTELYGGVPFYHSADYGTSWTEVGSSFFDSTVSCMALSGTTVYVGTFGGVWVYTADNAVDNTPPGNLVSVQPVNAATGTSPVTVTFDVVTAAGNTSLVMSDAGPTPSGGFQLGDPPVYYDIATTAQWSGQIKLCFSYADSSFLIPENLVILHYEGGTWVDTKATVDTTARRICCTVTSLSPFALVEPIPLKIKIDIKPGTFPNSIDPTKSGLIPVAILTTATFDATKVDPLSVRFGPRKAKEVHGKGHLEDVNGDRKLDMMLHFNTNETGIQCGETQASLTGRTMAGKSIMGTDALVTVGCGPRKDAVMDEIPTSWRLEQNFPNPFNPTTTIRYSLPQRSHVTLTLLNPLGQKVAELVNADIDAGYHSVQFNAGNLASGVYFYRLQAGSYTETRKLCVMK